MAHRSHLFARPPLSTAEAASVLSCAHETLGHTLSLHDVPFTDSRFAYLGDINRVSIYQGAPRPHTTPYRSYTSLIATIEEVEALATSSKLFVDDVVETNILFEVSPDVQIKWFAMNCPAPLSNRDFCVVEKQHEVAHTSGRRAFAVVQKSVSLAGCGALSSWTRGVVLYSGLVFVESLVAGMLDVQATFEVDLKGNIPAWLYKSVMKSRAGRLRHLDARIQEKRLLDNHTFAFVAMVPKARRSHCNFCTKSFSLLRRKCNCKVCGEVYCWKCTTFRRLETDESQRVCMSCSNDAVTCTMSQRSRRNFLSSARGGGASSRGAAEETKPRRVKRRRRAVIYHEWGTEEDVLVDLKSRI